MCDGMYEFLKAEIRFWAWQESVLSDPVSSMEDDFILESMTASDFIE